MACLTGWITTSPCDNFLVPQELLDRKVKTHSRLFPVWMSGMRFLTARTSMAITGHRWRASTSGPSVAGHRQLSGAARSLSSSAAMSPPQCPSPAPVAGQASDCSELLDPRVCLGRVEHDDLGVRLDAAEVQLETYVTRSLDPMRASCWISAT